MYVCNNYDLCNRPTQPVPGKRDSLPLIDKPKPKPDQM